MEDSRDKDLVRSLRRDLEEYKRRSQDNSSEANEIRKERDAMKLERNELIIANAKEVEEERSQRRGVQTENEKFKFRVKCLEEEVQKLQLKGERKN